MLKELEKVYRVYQVRLNLIDIEVASINSKLSKHAETLESLMARRSLHYVNLHALTRVGRMNIETLRTIKSSQARIRRNISDVSLLIKNEQNEINQLIDLLSICGEKRKLTTKKQQKYADRILHTKSEAERCHTRFEEREIEELSHAYIRKNN